MSYYRRTDGSQPSPKGDCRTPIRKPKDHSNVIVEAVISPTATTAPLTMNAVKNGNMKRMASAPRRPTVTQHVWGENICAFPTGKCQRAPVGASPFCMMHACNAVNADGNRCGNLVVHPGSSRFCTAGYHIENERFEYVEELQKTREEWSKMEAVQRKQDHHAHVEYFSRHFSAAETSPTTSQSTLEDDPRSTVGTSAKSSGSYDPELWSSSMWRSTLLPEQAIDMVLRSSQSSSSGRIRRNHSTSTC